MRGAVVEWSKRLGYGGDSRRKVVSSNPGFAIRQQETFSVSPAVNGSCFESEKDKAAKGEGWVLPFICCPIDTVGL